jgi:hypothetical protein
MKKKRYTSRTQLSFKYFITYCLPASGAPGSIEEPICEILEDGYEAVEDEEEE